MKLITLILNPILLITTVKSYTINMSNAGEFNNFNQFLNYIHYKNININDVLSQGSLKNSDYEQFKRLQKLVDDQHTAPGLGILSQLPVVGSVTKPLGTVLSGVPFVGPILEQLL
ncbi:hypothetical protein CONCODRAFT_10276 [Conidiobolus coronatus NRRL 28638]|uniref:Uncharacterized protein n=1 Tax=Conidiobolus coronatus (strain ATCC 28846 / CBS 209.66 / NRRL 28638) TaxID=796925 RepID=A0A137NYE1_CONC2|nr:hypothetical protein CONCODRAFT_10276 [Conidiobolus coronatus NRRL 28638]|eukprot:KXN67619.1 hypothetical protein CONCODRAFT_10276 [Conidiobolus coronatus NRRL 28638]